MPLNRTWLNQAQEDPLEPELPICDPHQHFWNDRPALGSYMLEDLQTDIASGHRVVSTVFVECLTAYRAHGPESHRPVGETEFARGIAAMSASGHYGDFRAAAGIVGHADLRLGHNVGPVLEAHIAAAPKQFRGIRHIIASDPELEPSAPTSDTDLESAVFRNGVEELARHGLVLETYAHHHQIPGLAALARAFPTVTIVIDHLGGPLGVKRYANRREEVFAEWRRNIDDISSEPNVVMKLGGVGMRTMGHDWHRRELPPSSDDVVKATGHFIEYAIERFGPTRCMFESNFPVDGWSCSYGVVWNAFKRMVAGASAREKRDLFHDTAARVYRLGA